MTKHAWEKFAEADPYWAVLTDPRFKVPMGGSLSEEEHKIFFGIGKTYVAGVLQTLKTHFGRSFTKKDCCLDFGSGVGRLLIPMARQCGRAIGLDISPTMRRLCYENAMNFGIGNIECYPDIDHLSLDEPGFDWVNSFIVFQHIETKQGYRLLEKLLRRVKPNGAISLHFTIYKDRRIGSYIADRYRYFTVDENGVRNVVPKGSFYPDDVMMMNDYDVTRLFMLLSEHGFQRVLTHHEDQDGMHGLIFFAIKDG